MSIRSWFVKLAVQYKKRMRIQKLEAEAQGIALAVFWHDQWHNKQLIRRYMAIQKEILAIKQAV